MMKQKQFRKLALSAATMGLFFGVAMPGTAAGDSEKLKAGPLTAINGSGIMIDLEDGRSVNADNMPAATLSNPLEPSLGSNQKVNEEGSVMQATFYSELQEGNVPGASVQIGSTLPQLKQIAGEPEAQHDFEGGIRHVYGNYAYGVPYVANGQESEPVTTVTYHFKDKPTVEEVRRYMGSAQESAVEEGMDFEYLWYSKDDYEVFFEFPTGADKVDNVTVKWNYSF